jgi:hypothetical protein
VTIPTAPEQVKGVGLPPTPPGPPSVPTTGQAGASTPEHLKAARPKGGNRRIVATYDYCDEHGHLLYQVVRYEPGRDGREKDFRQRHPNGSGGWIWNLRGVRRLLYRLPELYEAPRDRLVFVVEGEKDVDRLRAEGLVATTNAMGAGKWCAEYGEFLRGRHVIILADNDEPGRKHAWAVAESLKGVAASIKVVELPGLPEKGDVSDWLMIEGNDKIGLLKMAHAAPQLWQADATDRPGADAADDGPSSSSAENGKAKPTQAEVLLGLAEAHDHFQADDGRAYAAVNVETPEGTHCETMPVRSMAYRQVLARAFYLETRKAASSGVLQDVLGVLEARARYEGQCRDVGIRVMQANGRVYLDLADGHWRAVEIGPEGWRVLDRPPVHFRRPRGMLPLPLPVRGGCIDELRQLANVGSDTDWRLVVAWLVQAFLPTGPYPVLCAHGEQGTAKSTFTKMLRNLIDPNRAPLRPAPRDERDLVIAASNSWVIALDNLSHLEPWLSDALCRLATGGGYATRELYSDTDETILDAQRPILLNGIEELTSRPDLLDRAIVLTLPTLGEGERLAEGEVWARYDRMRPAILGAILDATAGALRHREHVRLPRLPRMADFAVTGEAAGAALGWRKGEFVGAYAANRDEQTGTILDGSIVYPALRAVVPIRGEYAGTATDLLAALAKEAGERSRDRAWPGSGRVLAGILRRLAPTLRKTGLIVEFTRSGHARQRLVRVTDLGEDRNEPREAEEVCNPPSAPSAASAGGTSGEGDTGCGGTACGRNADVKPPADGSPSAASACCPQTVEAQPGQGQVPRDAADAADAADDRLHDCSDSGIQPADLPGDWHQAWEERASIMEFDGGLPREHAEALALKEILAQMRQVDSLPRRPGGGNAS